MALAGFAFTDPVHGAQCVLVVPPGGQLTPPPGGPKIGVAHPGGGGGEPCIVLADLALELDAFYCRLCSWNGRISGAWAASVIASAAQAPLR